MKVISSQSFKEIAPLISQGISYVNIHGRLRQKLTEEESGMFSHIQMENNGARWLVPDNLTLQPYSAANATEKEEIAIFIEEKKEAIERKLSSEMSYVSKLFQIPSEQELFWYRGKNGSMQVVLAQWGFVKCNRLKDVNIIDFILIQPRTITQTEVTLHIEYSDGKPAEKATFKLTLLNNTKDIVTDNAGDFYVGNLYAGKTFCVEDPSGEKREFVVEKDVKLYTAVFDLHTNWKIKVVNQERTIKRNFAFVVDGENFTTDEKGFASKAGVLLSPGKAIEVSAPNCPKAVFSLRRDPEDNIFEYCIDDPVTAYVIKVMNQHEGLKENYPLLVNGQEMRTDTSGCITSDEMLYVPGSIVTVSGTDKKDVREYTISQNRDENTFIYTIEEKEPPKPEPVTRIRVLDYYGSPLPDLKVNVKTKSGKILSSTTDENGYVTFMSSNFVDGEKPQVDFVITKEYQKSHPLTRKGHGKKD